MGTRLTLEVTETAAVRDLMGARQWMERLTELGCRLALDEFGRGFSSFTYLNALPAHFIKLDGSYVASLEADAKNRALVESITRVAHTLGKEVVAEWVETPEIGRILAEMGVEYGQGYGLGRPSPTWAPAGPRSPESVPEKCGASATAGAPLAEPLNAPEYCSPAAIARVRVAVRNLCALAG